MPFDFIYEYFINPDDFGEDYIRLEVSPSGEAVCVLYEHDEANMLALLRSDGTQIATMDTRLSFYGAQADWSPDGQWLAFTSRGNNTYTDIYIIDANGENLRQLTNNHAANSSPFFLPLGEDIIYWEDSSPRVMNLSDGSIHYTDYSRSWTQDEQYYLYSPSAQRVELRNAETHARQTIYVPQNPHHYIYQTIITRDGNWALIGEYDPAGETIFHGYYNWYKININHLDQIEFIATARYLELSYDQTLVIFDGWLPDESIYGEPKYYAMNLEGTHVIPLSDQGHNLLYGYWLLGSISTVPIDPFSFLGPTPVPPWAPLPDAPVYDSFEGGTIDPALWHLPEIPPDSPFQWNVWDGGLNIRTEQSIRANGIDFYLNTVNTIRELNTFASRVKLWSGTYGSVFLKMQLSATIEGHEWWTQCRLGVVADEPSFVCEVYSHVGQSAQLEYMTRRIPAFLSTWNDVRIELSPDFGALQFYFNGEVIGTYQPLHANELLSGVVLHPAIGVWSHDGSINASFDDVRIDR